MTRDAYWHDFTSRTMTTALRKAAKLENVTLVSYLLEHVD